jgi:hypothetical protein
MRNQRCSAQVHGFSISKHLVNRVLFAARLYRLKRRDVLGHRHHLRAGQLLH